MSRLILPRIDVPVPLTFIPDVQFGAADGKPLLLAGPARPDMPAAPRPAVVWVHVFSLLSPRWRERGRCVGP